jgi:hypothetical protein
MSQNDSFIHEVTEEMRKERAARLFRKYGWIVVLAIFAVVLAAAANEVLKSRAEARARAAGDAMIAAMAEADPALRAEKLAALAAGGAAPAPLARLSEAAALLEKGDGGAAAALLAALAADPATPPLIADLARVKSVLAAGSEMPEGERLAILEPMSVAGHPFRLIALEQRALIRLESGDREGALADLTTVAEAAEAGPSARARASQLIIALGGELPQAATKVQ